MQRLNDLRLEAACEPGAVLLSIRSRAQQGRAECADYDGEIGEGEWSEPPRPASEAGDPGEDIDPRLAFLPADRQKLIREVERRFSEGLTQVLNGHEPPDCDDPFVCLREQREAALAQLLNPDEREEYELRLCPAAEALREQLQGVAVTESEFRQVYQLRRAIEEKFPSHPLDFLNSERLHAREQMEAQVEEEVKRILGPERYRLYRRSQS